MAHQTPHLRVPLRGELLVKLTQRFPNVDSRAIDLLNTIKSVTQIINDTLAETLISYEMTEGKFFTLAYLYIEELLAHPAPSPSDIADNLGVTRATVTGLLDGLERCGLIARRTDDTDRRMLSVEITAKAKHFVDEMFPSIVSAMQPLINDALKPTEQDTLLALMTTLEESLQANAR